MIFGVAGHLKLGKRRVVGLDGVDSNQLLEILADWSEQLEAIDSPVSPAPSVEPEL